MAFTDGRYLQFPDAPPPLEETGGPQVKDVSGTVLPGISKWAYSAGGEYVRRGSFLTLPGEYFARLDTSYRSAYSSSPSASRYLVVDSYFLMNPRAGFRSRDGWGVSVWARDLGNANYFEPLAPQPGNTGLYTGLPGDQRTFGITLSRSFAGNSAADDCRMRGVTVTVGPGRMRQLSKKTQYSLRALYALTRHYGQGPVLIQDLSTAESIPKKFLEQILLTLKGFGLVHSKKGKGGGYSLAQPPKLIMLGPVIRMMEGPLAPLPCASETRYRKCEECPDAETCATRIVMKQVRDAIAGVLDNISLEEACRRADEAALKKPQETIPAAARL